MAAIVCHVNATATLRHVTATRVFARVANTTHTAIIATNVLLAIMVTLHTAPLTIVWFAPVQCLLKAIILLPAVRFPMTVIRSVANVVQGTRVNDARVVRGDSTGNRNVRATIVDHASARATSIQTNRAHAIPSPANVCVVWTIPLDRRAICALQATTVMLSNWRIARAVCVTRWAQRIVIHLWAHATVIRMWLARNVIAARRIIMVLHRAMVARRVIVVLPPTAHNVTISLANVAANREPREDNAIAVYQAIGTTHPKDACPAHVTTSFRAALDATSTPVSASACRV